MRILIVGLGYTGAKMARLLRSTNHEIFGLRRSPALPGDTNPCHLIVGDLHDDATLDMIPSSIDIVVYAISPDERSEAAYRQAYPNGLQRTIGRCPNARFIFLSSTGVYDQTGGVHVDDTSPARNDAETALILREAEDLLLLRNRQDVILRASGIYGPGRTSLISQLLVTELPESDRNIWTNRIHRNDLAQAAVFIIDRPAERGVFIASDPRPATLGEIQDWLRSQEQAQRLPSVRSMRTGAVRKNRCMDAQRLRALGFEFQYPSYREGYSEVLSSLPPAA